MECCSHCCGDSGGGGESGIGVPGVKSRVEAGEGEREMEGEKEGGGERGEGGGGEEGRLPRAA